jgi:hypothetical protein
MRTILYVAYLIGAIITIVCDTFLEPAQTLPIVVFSPLVIFMLLEFTGIVQFRTVRAPKEEDFSPLISQATSEDLTDEQAAAKYGWALVIEMDNIISRLEGVGVELMNKIKDTKERRDQFAQIVKGIKK